MPIIPPLVSALNCLDLILRTFYISDTVSPEDLPVTAPSLNNTTLYRNNITNTNTTTNASSVLKYDVTAPSEENSTAIQLKELVCVLSVFVLLMCSYVLKC